LPGCAVLEKHFGSPLPLDQVEQIESGTHYSAVIEELGPPTTMTALTGGMAFQYEYIHLTEWQWGLILPGNVGKYFKAVYGTADADIELMTFVFDDEGTLSAADAKYWVADAGAGFSFSLIFSVGALTDTERYAQASAGALEWGASLTEPPLKMLNARSNLDTGTNGFQLTATTPRAGQHTLELGR
jgi:hypothetical protein